MMTSSYPVRNPESWLLLTGMTEVGLSSTLHGGLAKPQMADRCWDQLRVPDEVTDGRKNMSGTRGGSSIRRQGLGRRHRSRLANWNLKTGRDLLEALTW